MRWLVLYAGLGFASFALTLAALPVRAVERGVDPDQAGLVTTVMFASTIAVQPLVPRLMRWFGGAHVLASGVVLLSLPCAGYLSGISPAWWWMFSALRGVGFGMLTVGGVVVLASIVPAARRGEGVGLHGLAVNLPVLVGVPLGAAVTISGHFAIVATVAALPASFAALSARACDRSIRERLATTQASPGTSASELRRRRSFLPPILLLMAVAMVASGYTAYVPVDVADGRTAGAALFVFGAASLLSRWRVGLVADRVGLAVILPAALVVSAGGFLVVATALAHRDPRWLVLGSLVAGVGYGAIQNGSLTSCLGRAGRDVMPASAAWNIGFDVGFGLGAVVVGHVAGSGLGVPAGLALPAALLLTAVPLAIVAGRPARHPRGDAQA